MTTVAITGKRIVSTRKYTLKASLIETEDEPHKTIVLMRGITRENTNINKSIICLVWNTSHTKHEFYKKIGNYQSIKEV